MTLASGQRRRIPGGRSLKVPLLDPHPKGQILQGLIRVPSRLANAELHTNEFLELQKKIMDDIKKWVAYRESRGWKITTKPEINGPHDPSVQDSKTEADPDEKWYWITARFSRIEPVYISLEDHLAIMDSAKRYGVDVEKDTLPWNNPNTGFEFQGSAEEFKQEWNKRYPKDGAS